MSKNKTIDCCEWCKTAINNKFFRPCATCYCHDRKDTSFTPYSPWTPCFGKGCDHSSHKEVEPKECKHERVESNMCPERCADCHQPQPKDNNELDFDSYFDSVFTSCCLDCPDREFHKKQLKDYIAQTKQNTLESVVNDMGNMWQCKDCRKKNQHISDKYKLF